MVVACMRDEVPDLPDLATLKILENFGDSSIFQLLTLAGVCTTWRAMIKQLEIPHLSIDTNLSMKGEFVLPKEHSQFCAGSGGLANHLKRFRQLDVDEKTRMYEAVTQLLTKQRSSSCTGEAINDKIVTNLASPCLQSLTLEGCPKVTDRSVSILLLKCPSLRHVSLKNMFSISGAFLPALLLQSRRLESLSLSNLSGPEWSLPLEACLNSTTLPDLKSLVLESVSLDKGAHSFFRCFPRLKFLSIDSSPALVRAAANYCPELEEIVLNVNSPKDLDNCLAVLISAPSLRTLELCPTCFRLTQAQMRLAGILNLTELRLEAPAFKLQPLHRMASCHLDNDGVKVLVDSICQRQLHQPGRQPFKLSLCGAASISHDAVSALLRLPLLSGLSLDGCTRISSIDKMRLIAKVKAGRELLDGKPRRKINKVALPLDACRSI